MTEGRGGGRWPAQWGLPVGLAATLLLLMLHAREYVFLTDDAYISFRYARNLAAGHGLVFNPGLEPVEGYTNFLWVLILAGLSVLGAPPPWAAQVLSLGATVVLWVLVAAWALRHPPQGRSWPILVPTLLLASTRSVAVWATSGLETRLFEVLVLAGALRLLLEARALARGDAALRPVAAILFALATLTRPDGLLVSGCALGSAGVVLWARRGIRKRAFFTSWGVYVAVVGAHFLFRRFYYGEWLPNTWYPTGGGRLWWGMGWAHHATLALEYGMVLWLPLVVVGALRSLRRGEAFQPLVFAAIVVPHALYVAAIGGDHFEYRPQDLYFPFLFLLAFEGTKELARSRRTAAAVLAWLAVVEAGIVAIPLASHRQFPKHYEAGFPGWETARPEGRLFLHPDRDPLLRAPPWRWMARGHRDLLRRITRSFVGIRQEEHRLFLETVEPEARRLRALVEEGTIPRDAHFALDSVGMVPYVTDLVVLDRLGLTDAYVARWGEAASGERLLAHDRRATLEYAREQGVDFWAFDSVHSLYRREDPRLADLIGLARQHALPVYWAPVGEAWVMLGLLPQGAQEAARRFPRLTFRSVQEPGTLSRLRKEKRSFEWEGSRAD